MDPQWKKKWVKALRSGEYKQGSEYLRHGDEFCCLGVLCDLVKDSLNMDWALHDEEGVHSFDGHTDYLPQIVLSKVKMNEHNPEVEYRGKKYCLSHLNDGFSLQHTYTPSLNFNEIADLIEEKF